LKGKRKRRGGDSEEEEYDDEYDEEEGEEEKKKAEGDEEEEEEEADPGSYEILLNGTVMFLLSEGNPPSVVLRGKWKLSVEEHCSDFIFKCEQNAEETPLLEQYYNVKKEQAQQMVGNEPILDPKAVIQRLLSS